MLGSTHLCCWPWVGLGWQVRRGSHGLLGPNPPMSFPSSFREWAPPPRPPEPLSLRQLPLWLYFRNIRSGKASACTVTDYRFSSPLSKEAFPTALSCLASWNLVFYFPVDICAPSFLPECRASGSLSAPLFRSSQSPTWTYRGLLGGSCVILDKPMSFPDRFFCWFRLPFLFSSSPLPSLNTARPQLVHLPFQHRWTHPPAPYSVTGPVHTRHPNGLVGSAPQNLPGAVSLCPWTTRDSCGPGLGRVCPREAGCSGVRARAWLHFPSPHCASSGCWGHQEEKVPHSQGGGHSRHLCHAWVSPPGCLPVLTHTCPVELASPRSREMGMTI